MFQRWVDQPHNQDEMSDDEDDKEEEVVQEKASVGAKKRGSKRKI